MELSNEILVREYQAAIAENNARKCSKTLLALYEMNRGLLWSIAKRYSDFAEIDDLLQEGYIGLQKAANLYDLSFENDVKFSTYATTWIKQGMRKYVAECGLIRVPSYLNQRIYNLEKIQNDYEVKFGKSPSDRELCSFLDITPEQLDLLRKTKSILYVRSFDEQISNDSETTLGETVPDENDSMQNVIDSVYKKTLSSVLWREVDDLGENEADVYRLRYQDQYSFREISEKTGKSVNEVKVIHDRAMKKLRKSPLIASYREDFIQSHNPTRDGLKSFLRTNTSVTEKIALKLYEGTIKESLKLIRK